MFTDISIVIVTYNSAAVIGPCLTSLFATQGDLALEIIIVDNGSTDDTLTLLQRDFPTVTLLTGHGNVGFARGNNLGFQASHGRYLFMLNPDTEVYPGALHTLLAYADTHPTVGMLAPHMVYPDGTLQHNTFHFPDLAQAFYGFFERLVPLDSPKNGRYLPEDYTRERPVEHILGAAVFIRRELYEQLGGMDPAYPLYFEETDWCFRAHRAGWQLRYIPTATVMHIGAHSTTRDPERSSVLFARSRARFYRKSYGLPGYLALKVITLLGLTYWQARTLAGLFRRRITWPTFTRRQWSYWHILWA